ncbi:MAG: nucleotidyl transferase AbiEii/AbiGii toxin family protein [Treponema sp.]|nr:nucleotidyl transferase AbiEii/AbiGii toxin family protein [Treponema sp.]
MNNNAQPMSAESIKAKLKKEADTSKKDFNFLLLHYFIERILFRLSISPYVNNFILKGGMLLYTVLDNQARATRDVDFLAKNIKNTPDELVKIFSKIASIPADDAVSFDTKNIDVERIKEEADYQGIRIKLTAYLDRSRHVLQFDIGFNDIIVPHPVEMIYPTLLDMEPPRLKAYSLESVIAEKFQAIVYLADLNSRMKDFYDIYELSRHCDFDGAALSEAIAQTFRNRKTEIIPQPIIFNEDFSSLPDKQVQWQAFQRRTGIISTPTNFSLVVLGIKGFLLPVYEALVKKVLFVGKWNKETAMWHFSTL